MPVEHRARIGVDDRILDGESSVLANEGGK